MGCSPLFSNKKRSSVRNVIQPKDVPPPDNIKSLPLEVKIDSKHKEIINEEISEGLKSYLKEGILFEDLDIETSKVIGKGGFGDVLKITLKSDKNKSLAVKVMNVHNKDKQAIDDMNNEMDLLDKISKQSIKPRCFPIYYGYFVEFHRGFYTVYNICFNYQPNTLHSFIKEHNDLKIKIKNEILIKFFNTLVSGFCFLQLMGICHRDLKPQNLLLDETKENLTVIDFGASKNVISQTIHASQTKVNVTVIGTKSYCSPEILEAFQRDLAVSQNSPIDTTGDMMKIKINPFKSDAFSFGLLVFELMTLEKLKNNSNQEKIDARVEMIKKQISQDNVVSEEIRKKLEGMTKILSKCLQINPQERWDFIQIFTETIDFSDMKKLRFHIKLEECQNYMEIEEFLLQGFHKKK